MIIHIIQNDLLHIALDNSLNFCVTHPNTKLVSLSKGKVQFCLTRNESDIVFGDLYLDHYASNFDDYSPYLKAY